jgi:hypothetical protein
MQALPFDTASITMARRSSIHRIPGVEKSAERNHGRLMGCLLRTQSQFLLDNDPSLIPVLLSYLRENLVRAKLCDEIGLIRVTVALSEALLGAMVQGNLEIDPELWERNESAYQRLLEQRRRQKPYCDRRVRVIAQELLHEARYVVRHEGPGFDYSALPDCDEPGFLDNIRACGLLLIRTCMDQVTHNEAGNEITLVKRRDP